MAKKKNKESKKAEVGSEESKFSFLQEETVHGILAIAFFVLAVFLTLSAFNKAGFVGEKIHEFLTYLFGLGFWLMPLILIMLCVSFLNSLKKSLVLSHSIGGLLFFLSTLSLMNIVLTDTGGVVGRLISTPLLSLFDLYASVVILVAFIIIALLVMFDIPLPGYIAKLWKRSDAENLPETTLLSTTIAGNTELKFSPASALAIKEANEETRRESIMQPKPAVPLPAVEVKKEGDFTLGKTTLSGREFVPPPLSLLEKDKGKPGVGDIKANSNIIKRTLANFGINVEMDEISIGPSITRYALKPAEGVKLTRITGLQSDLSLALAAHPIRIEAPIPGKSLVGIEIPNTTKTTVGLGTLLASSEFQNSPKPLLFCVGKGISGLSYFANLAKSPHMLIAGATGSGKSVTIHAIITSLLYRNSPDNLKFIMIDPKRVELTLYNKIPHLLTPVITDAKKSIASLKWAAKEMDRRYDILQSESLQNIESYHKNVVEPALKKMKDSDDPNATVSIDTMPYIVVVIDELADIMQTYPRELEAAIVRLAQMSRAVGIHLILSTQRPSVNVITGLIKANVPSRIALQVASQIDSRTILDMGGAEKLLGAGDMLYLSGEMSQPQRIQSAYISEDELKGVVKYLADRYQNDIPNQINLGNANSENNSKAMFDSAMDDDDDAGDDLYEEARQIVVSSNTASTSYLQRKLGIGYARSARIIDMLEERGVIGSVNGSKRREVLNPTGDAASGEKKDAN